MDSGKKIISLIVPTRGRTKLLRKFLNSITSTAKDFFSFEIVFIYDDDDIETKESLVNLKDEYTIIDISLLHRKRKENISDKYYNWAWKRGYLKGDYYWVLGDDVTMITRYWDEKIIEGIENFLSDKPDRISCFFPIDDSPNKPFIRELGNRMWGWFPVITKEACEAVGFILPIQYPAHGADVYLAKIYTDIFRYCPMFNVFIHTSSANTEKMAKDGVARNIGRISEQSAEYARNNYEKFFKRDTNLLRTKINARMVG